LAAAKAELQPKLDAVSAARVQLETGSALPAFFKMSLQIRLATVLSHGVGLTDVSRRCSRSATGKLTPQTAVEWQTFRLTGQDPLAVRASKRLRNEELVSGSRFLVRAWKAS
jgi:hypothetical protein